MDDTEAWPRPDVRTSSDLPDSSDALRDEFGAMFGRSFRGSWSYSIGTRCEQGHFYWSKKPCIVLFCVGFLP